MAETTPTETVRQLLRENPGFRLKPYRSILEQVIEHAGSIDQWQGRSLLELGPGTRLDLLRFCNEKTPLAQATGAGQIPKWWFRTRCKNIKFLSNTFLRPFLEGTEADRFDLILSRHVLEEHSIHPWILLASRSFWRHIKENRMRDRGQDYPASRANLQAVFREAFRVLKPGGVMVSQIGKKKHSVLHREFLESFKPRFLHEQNLGLVSNLITLVK